MLLEMVEEDVELKSGNFEKSRKGFEKVGICGNVLMFVDNRGIWRIDLNECKNFEWRIMIIDDNYFCVFFLLCLIYYFS